MHTHEHRQEKYESFDHELTYSEFEKHTTRSTDVQQV